jgi:hypothetical protein
MTPNEAVREDGRWKLPIAGRQVTRCCADYAAVQFVFDNGVEIYIEQSFALRTSEGASFSMDPDGAPELLAPILKIRRQEAQSGYALDDGTLELRFSDDSYLTVPPDAEYEAWNVSGIRRILVSLPGGGLG